MECRLAGETEILGETLPQPHFLSITKSHMTIPGFETGPPRGESATIIFLFQFLFVCEAIGTASIPSLLCQPRVLVKMIVEK
jgi:hypothetical protein